MQVLHAKVEEIVAWRYKLEGVGLIQVFVDEHNERLTYILKKPLSQRQFFNDGIINVFLNLKVGNVDYQFIKQYFSEESEEGIGKNVSKPFNEVFDTTVLSRHSQLADVTPVQSFPSEGVKLEQAFNEELLLTLLTQFGLDDKVLSDKLMDQLNKIAFLYKLDEHELARLIFDAIDADGFVNMELFRKQAKQYFQFINKGKPVQMVEVPIHSSADQRTSLKLEEHVGSKDDKLMHYLTHTNPIDFLKQKSHQKDPVPADRQLVEWLLVDQQFPPGVVNVLVDYVLKVSDGRLPRALVEKIAGEWTRKDINSVDKAIKQVKLTLKAKDKREQTAKTTVAKPTYSGKRQPIRQEKVPDWLQQSSE
ncbi:MAG: DnaD domain protein, partial [Turicibacter sp.]